MAINLTTAQTIVTSAAKAYEAARKLGTLNMDIIALFNLIAYYAEFTRGKAEYNQEHAFLLHQLNSLKYDFPDIICNYKEIAPGNININIPVISNTAPVVTDNVVDILGEDTYQFKVIDFTNGYSDAENHNYKYLIFYPVTLTNGALKQTPAGEIESTDPIIIDIEDLPPLTNINLYFVRETETTFSGVDIFSFRVSDNPEDYLYSNLATITVNASVASGTLNQPATIGDNTIYVDNRAITTLTLAMFTSQLTPPYNDPEADLIDAIRIDEISTANAGVFYLNGTEILEGDIITREDLEANLFTHEGPDQDSINSDVFNFSARDEGSQTWVQ